MHRAIISACAFLAYLRMNAAMNVSLISQDTELGRLCRETLSDLFGKDLNFSVSPAGVDIANADVCIWDYEPGLVVSDVTTWSPKQTHLFVVHLRHINALCEQLP